MSTAEFKRIEDRAVDEAIALQEEVGLDVVTDGEQRRLHFRDWLTRAVDGLSPIKAPPMRLQGMPGHSDVERCDPLTVTGKIRLKRSVATEEFTYARGKTSKPLKITVPHPFTYHLMYGPESRQAYPDPFELFHDAALLLWQECRELADLGCEYIQIDAPVLTLPIDPKAHESFTRMNVSPQRFLEEGVRIMDVIANVPGVKFAAHYCRGNSPTHYFSGAGFDAAAKILFRGSKNVGTYLLEYDDSRSGSFEPLADVPRDKRVVLGLVTTKRNVLESADELIGRIEEAARFFPRDQLALSTQCGFASGIKGNPVEPAMQERKLTLVADVARRVWG